MSRLNISPEEALKQKVEIVKTLIDACDDQFNVQWLIDNFLDGKSEDEILQYYRRKKLDKFLKK